MGRELFPAVLILTMVAACSMTPEQHRDQAFHQYSLECVARGIPEDTPEHTRCVVEKYQNYTMQQRDAEKKMRELFAKPKSAKAMAEEDNYNEW